jgi:hypothetical protein
MTPTTQDMSEKMTPEEKGYDQFAKELRDKCDCPDEHWPCDPTYQAKGPCVTLVTRGKMSATGERL